MKKLIYIIGVVALLSSCATTYEVTTGSLNQTKVELNSANFNNLGTFSGNATEKRMKSGIRNMEGLISIAKKDLIANARKTGIELSGSWTMTNISVDVMKNPKRVTVTVSANIIKFTK